MERRSRGSAGPRRTDRTRMPSASGLTHQNIIGTYDSWTIWVDHYCGYNNSVIVTFDPAKRDTTLATRGLDFADASMVFAGLTFDWRDERADYGEARWITVGYLTGRMVVVVWTARGESRHVISMRKANDREQARFRDRLE